MENLSCRQEIVAKIKVPAFNLSGIRNPVLDNTNASDATNLLDCVELDGNADLLDMEEIIVCIF
mgnify:CR=1 FL=1